MKKQVTQQKFWGMASTRTVCSRVKVIVPPYQVCVTLLLCSSQDISYSICFSQTFSKWSHKKQSENTGRYDSGLFACLSVCLFVVWNVKRDTRGIWSPYSEKMHTPLIYFICGRRLENRDSGIYWWRQFARELWRQVSRSWWRPVVQIKGTYIYFYFCSQRH